MRAAAESSSQWFLNTIVDCGGNGFACTCTRLHTYVAVSHHVVVTDDWTHDLEPVKWISYFFKLLLPKKGDYRDIGGTVTGFAVIR